MKKNLSMLLIMMCITGCASNTPTTEVTEYPHIGSLLIVNAPNGLINVLVFKRNLQEDDVLTVDNLAVKQFPLIDVQSRKGGFLSESAIDFALGKHLAHPVKKGDIVDSTLIKYKANQDMDPTESGR